MRVLADGQTHTQTQTDFIICPMLYAIAMGQIIIISVAANIVLNNRRREGCVYLGRPPGRMYGRPSLYAFNILYLLDSFL